MPLEKCKWRLLSSLMCLFLAVSLSSNGSITVALAQPWYPWHYWYWPWWWGIRYYLTVDMNPPGIGEPTGAGWYYAGSSASFSAPLTISSGAGIQYVFTYWSGDYSGTSSSGAITMTGPKTVTANYKIQYYLTLATNPQSIAAITGEGWYDGGATAATAAAPSSIPVGTAKQHVFTGWLLDGSRVTGNPISVVMNTPHTATAEYKTQYYLKVVSRHGDPQGEGWYDSGSTATFSVTSPIQGGMGIQYVFERWEGDSSTTEPTATIVMDSARVVNAVWKVDYTQLYIIIAILVAVAFLMGVAVTLALRKMKKKPEEAEHP